MNDPSASALSSRSFHYLTLVASSIYFGDILTWIILLYCECHQLQLQSIQCSYLWLFILCAVHLLQSPFINSTLNSLPRMNASATSTEWSIICYIKSFLCTPLYPFLYHPFIYSLIFGSQSNQNHNVNNLFSNTSSPPLISIELNGADDKYEDDTHYVAFWKLFALNNAFALIRSLFVICLYPEARFDSIWFLSLLFTLLSVMSLFGIVAKLISHRRITFVFRWLCFTALYFGYMITLRWMSYINSSDSAHYLTILWLFKFMSLKVMILSVPFAIWLAFRKLYLTQNILNTKMYLTQCIISCIFYIFVWECCSFLFYVMAFYPKHYKNQSYYTLVFEWISPSVSDPNVIFRIIAFNYYILSKLMKLNHKQLDSNHDAWILSKYLCKHCTKCHDYYRLVTFEELRQCLSFSLIDLILWHYSSSINHHLIINHSTFHFLHFWLQKSFFLTFIFHIFSMLLTLCIPILFLMLISFESNHNKLNLHHLYCACCQWKLECLLTLIFNALLSVILILSPYILRFKYLIAHIFDYGLNGLNVAQSLDQHALLAMIKDVQQYYQQIVCFPTRDDILCNIYGRDIASIILQYLPSLHDLFYVE